MFYAVSDLANGIATVAGGMLLQLLFVSEEYDAMQTFTRVFVIGWLGRTAAAVLAATLIEPGAKRLRDLV